MEENIIIRAENVTKIFTPGGTVLDDVSLEIPRGAFVSITGASGSGKSTLLTILGGIDRPTSGHVYFDGADITAKTEKELAILRRTKVGFVFQFFNLAPYLTVYENIMLPIVLAGKRASDFKQKATDLMAYMNISEHAEKLPATLSGGEQQRTAIARSLIFEPEAVLLDEPTGNLDSKTGREIMNLLKKINEEKGTTIVQVTHSQTNASFASRIIRIEDGKILEPNSDESNVGKGEKPAKN